VRHARKHLIFVVKLVVAVGLITWLFRSGKIDLTELKHIGQGWPWFALAFVPFGFVLLLCGYRWRLLLRAQGIDYSFRDSLAVTMIGHFFNQFLIGTTGGDMVKAYVIATDHPEQRSAAVMSVFVDRVVGLLVLVAFALVGILFNLETIRAQPRLEFLATTAGIVFAASLFGAFLFFSERVRQLRVVQAIFDRLPLRHFVAKVARAVYVYKFHPGIVAGSVVISLVIHTLIVLLHLCVAKAILKDPFPWMTFFFLIPLAQIAMAIPIGPPGAVGTGEWIYATLLPLVNVPQGAAICFLQRFVHYGWALGGCTIYLRRRRKVQKAVQAATEAEEKGEEDFDGPREPAVADRARGLGSDGAEAERDRSLRAGVDSRAL
jgi:uncharacterized protein (TIRG00374 family)